MNKRNKKGFTLVELLAVIVILAIILVIAVPKISNVIESSKKSTFEETALNIVKAANYYYATSLLETSEQGLITFTVNNDKLMSGDNELAISGKAPVGDSWVKINEVGDVALRITDGVYYASKDFDETGVIVTEDEEAALTREELATELAELRSVVDGLTTNVNNNTDTINGLGNTYATKGELNSAISNIGTVTYVNNVVPSIFSQHVELISTTLEKGHEYILIGKTAATKGVSLISCRISFSSENVIADSSLFTITDGSTGIGTVCTRYIKTTTDDITVKLHSYGYDNVSYNLSGALTVIKLK